MISSAENVILGHILLVINLPVEIPLHIFIHQETHWGSNGNNIHKCHMFHLHENLSPKMFLMKSNQKKLKVYFMSNSTFGLYFDLS